MVPCMLEAIKITLVMERRKAWFILFLFAIREGSVYAQKRRGYLDNGVGCYSIGIRTIRPVTELFDETFLHVKTAWPKRIETYIFLQRKYNILRAL